MGTEARHQFAMLDGLRGVAAVSVLVFHERAWLNGGDWLMGHAFLSVDFFFMLSGFVLAHAYEDRLRERGSFAPFLRDRIIRLHPALIAGAVLAFLAVLYAQRQGHDALLAWWPLTLVASVIPLPAVWTGSADAFPWNLAIWSLFWELIANIAFALGARWLSNAVLVGIVAVSAAIMVAASQVYGGFQTGFSTALVPLALGLPRVCLSFFAGVLLLRVHRRRPAGDGWPGGEWTALLLIALLAAVPTEAAISPIYDPVVVILLFPPLLLAAARSQPSLPGWAVWAGAVSYPVYVLHLPLITFLNGVIAKAGWIFTPMMAPAAVVVVIATVIASYVVLRLYDEPVRAWLRPRFGSRRHRRPGAGAGN